MVMKICSKCKIQIDLDKFNKDKSRKDGYSYLCKKCQNKRTIESYYKHKKKRLATQKLYEKRIRENTTFKIRRNLSRRVKRALNGIKKSMKTMGLIGCSIPELKKHLQRTAIKNGYKDFNIESYNTKDYHIDHILPCKSFNLEYEDEQKECFNYKNLQILTARENLCKSSLI